jgi:Fuc2NAc and GlcNAc transferase
MAIVLTFIGALLVLWHELPSETLVALVVSGIVIGVLGFVDDHGHVPAPWRLLGHFGCAAWVLWWIGVPRFEWLHTTFPLGLLGAVLAALYLVWMQNLYNFMDGVDGIAGVEAVTVGLGGAMIGWMVGGPTGGLHILPALIAAAAGGFLVWNFPPARIFMGDVGSGFLGLMLGGMSIQAAIAHPVLLWSWLVLLGIFVVDATLTLIRRFLRGEHIFLAHRSHAYQHASRQFGSHRQVTLVVAAINVVWLMPWALAIASGQVPGVVGLAIAYCPLLVLAHRFKAGLP